MLRRSRPMPFPMRGESRNLSMPKDHTNNRLRMLLKTPLPKLLMSATAPDRSFPPRSKVIKSCVCASAGSAPVKRLFSNSNSLSRERRHSAGGMSPVKALSRRSSRRKRANFPSSDGMGPASWLLPRRSWASWSSSPNSGGRRPFSPIFDKSSATIRGGSPLSPTPCQEATGVDAAQFSRPAPSKASRAANNMAQSPAKPGLPPRGWGQVMR